MENNSIRRNLKLEDILSEITLLCGEDYRKEKTFVIVEGDDDLKFIKNKFNDNTYGFESFSGCAGVEKIVNYFQSDKRIIGIRDKDYSSLTSGYNKIFLYDYHSLEIMLAMNDESFESICSEFYCGDENVYDLRKKVFQKLKYISCFREKNSSEGWEFITENISIDELYRKTKLDCNEEIIKEINRPSKNNYDSEKQSIVEEHYHFVTDLKLITRGHDFSELFKVICNTSGIEKNIKSRDVESALRTSFTKESFKRTNLFQSLSEYEKSYGLNFLVS
ncbi:hypothetical protein [Streptococcus oralis]|uniref:DUF4435 domain-containing protein n=1 Tax=Streptococcus oralis subsp. oralis TaxID=1891914 RepID=A0A7H9FFA4_STROR|nr:hypothetical protein [Streptococcus oralis]EIC78752.1 hypothetical protein HMPREF1113_1625 [Streptococcus oralis SK10]KZX05765.1 hypothetical protein A4221_05110 [Streptococcus oralis]MBZ2092903.1 hypothetical protein [Streptococcus oralis]QLL97260.1 hypothetical protein HRJ33_08860 [Streptococcus oralis subsp. oralis]